MRTKQRQAVRLVACLAALVGLGSSLAGCGQDAAGAPPPPHNPGDVAFLHAMVPHHEHGIEMAKLAEHKGSAPHVKDLAHRIVLAQEHENVEMRKHLQEFGATGKGPVKPTVTLAAEARVMHDLEKAPPAEFDKKFLEHMMDHHVSAIHLAEIEIAAGQHPAVKHLAESMKALQIKEAEEMQRELAKHG